MKPSAAESEIDRIERELDAKNSPSGQPPARQAQSGGDGGDGSRKNQSMDAVLIGVVFLLGIGATFAFGERLTPTQQQHQLSSAAVGAAVGLAVGYAVGRLRP